MPRWEITNYIPILNQVRGYTRIKLRDDLGSALCSVALTGPLCLALALITDSGPDILILSTGKKVYLLYN